MVLRPYLPISQTYSVEINALADLIAILSHLGYSGIEKVDQFIDEDDFAFLIGVISDFGVVAMRAWSVPYELKHRLGTLDPKIIKRLPKKRLTHVLRSPTNLHRFPEQISCFVSEAAQQISNKYDNETCNIWNTTPSAREIKSRFRQFKGIGPKKAEMATKMLVRDKHLRLNDLWSIGLAPDIHVWRVLYRLGAISSNPGNAQELIKVGMMLNPTYPGDFDDAIWMLGRDICRPTMPACSRCPLNRLCKKTGI